MKKNIYSIIFFVIFAVDFVCFLWVLIFGYNLPAAILLVPLMLGYPLIALSVASARITRIQNRKKLVLARRILAAYFVLDILSGIVAVLFFNSEDGMLFIAFLPFYSSVGFFPFLRIVRHFLRGVIGFPFGLLGLCGNYIIYWLNFVLFLRALSKKIKASEQEEEFDTPAL